MAIVKLLKERRAWDKKKNQPYPLQQYAPLWVKLQIKPGTQDWLEHWKAHPEEQKSMSKHVLRKKKGEFNDKRRTY